MTNIQLYLAIAIPSIVIIVGFINNNSRLSRIEAAQDYTNKRLDTFVEMNGQLRERVALVEQHR